MNLLLFILMTEVLAEIYNRQDFKLIEFRKIPESEKYLIFYEINDTQPDRSRRIQYVCDYDHLIAMKSISYYYLKWTNMSAPSSKRILKEGINLKNYETFQVNGRETITCQINFPTRCFPYNSRDNSLAKNYQDQYDTVYVYTYTFK